MSCVCRTTGSGSSGALEFKKAKVVKGSEMSVPFGFGTALVLTSPVLHPTYAPAPQPPLLPRTHRRTSGTPAGKGGSLGSYLETEP